MNRREGPGFLEAFLLPLEGLRLILEDPPARRVLFLSILGNFAAMAALVAGGWAAWFAWGAGLVRRLSGGFLGDFLVFASGLIVLVLLVSLAFLVFPVLVPLVSGPFHEPLARRIEARVLGSPPPESPFGFFQGILHDLSVSLKLLLLEILALLLAGFSSFLFGSGLLVGLLLGSWLAALSWLDFPLARRGYSFSAERAWVRAHPGPAMGFGLAVTLSFMVPVYNLFLAAPSAAAGASMLYLRVSPPRGEG